MALIFPSNPTLNQVFSTGSLSWTWNGKSWNNGTSILVTSNLVSSSVQFTNGNTNAFDTNSNITVGQITASFAKISGSIFGTASFAILAQTSSYLENAQTASYVVLAQTASYVLNAVSASYSLTASYVALAQTASYVENAQTASYVTLAQTASYVTLSQTASYISTSSYALKALSASYAPNIYVLPSNVVSSSAQLSNGGAVAFDTNSNITVNQITASFAKITNLTVEYVTSSVMVITGSNKFGDASNDKQEFTGSVSVSGSLSVVGNVTSNNVLSLASGTVALPSLILSTDTTSGMYRIGANNIGVAISAAKVLDISSTGLSVTGALSASGGYNGSVGATTPSTVTATTLTTTGDVGIGTASPTQRLQVSNSAGSTYALITNTGTGPSNLFLGAGNGVTQIISRDATTGAVPIAIILGTTEIGRITSTGLNSTAIGATTRAAGSFTTVASSGGISGGIFTSTVSGTEVDFLLGNNDAGRRVEIGTNSGGHGVLKLRNASNVETITANAGTGLAVTGTLSSTGTLSTTSAASFSGAGLPYLANSLMIRNNGTGDSQLWALGPNTSTNGTMTIVTADSDGSATATVGVFTSTGLAVTGALSSTTGANFATSSGNVGIGTASPSAKLHVSNGASSTTQISLGPVAASGDYAFLSWNNNSGSQELKLYTDAGFMSFYANAAERARIDSSGNVIIGNTVANVASGFNDQKGLGYTASTGQVQIATTANAAAMEIGKNNANDGNIIVFRKQGTTVGNVSVTGSATTYNSGSDYRLKNITGLLTNSGVFIDALKPKIGTWKSDGSKFVGFLAHEFAEVSPSSVTGQKDAVDSDGNPVYQSMQASSAEVIANLVAELQSLRQRVAALEAK